MKCERCGIGFRKQAGDACDFCDYPFHAESDQRDRFERFIADRALTCPIAQMINHFWQANPSVPKEELMMLALTNYATKADSAALLLQDVGMRKPHPTLRLV